MDNTRGVLKLKTREIKCHSLIVPTTIHYGQIAQKLFTVRQKKQVPSMLYIKNIYRRTTKSINRSINYSIYLSFSFFFSAHGQALCHTVKESNNTKHSCSARHWCLTRKKQIDLPKENIQTVFEFFTYLVPLIFPMNKALHKENY